MAISGKYFYNQTEQALTTNYQKFQFPVAVRSITICNDAAPGGSNVIYSRDGTLQNGEVQPGESVPLIISGAPPRYIPDISVKSSAAVIPNYRIMAMEG